MPTFKPNLIDKVRAQISNKPLAQGAAMKWFQSKIKSLGGMTRGEILADKKRKKSNFLDGSMYFFVYSAKYADVLPYWDKFPLVFPIEFTENGFYGLNFHYLDYRTRLSLLTKLYDLATSTTLSNNTKMRLSYNILVTSAKYKEFKPCIKRYLFTNILSSPVRIGAPDWETVLFLPVDDFQKAGKTKVWNNSKKIINNSGSDGSTANKNVTKFAPYKKTQETE